MLNKSGGKKTRSDRLWLYQIFGLSRFWGLYTISINNTNFINLTVITINPFKGSTLLSKKSIDGTIILGWYQLGSITLIGSHQFGWNIISCDL